MVAADYYSSLQSHYIAYIMLKSTDRTAVSVAAVARFFVPLLLVSNVLFLDGLLQIQGVWLKRKRYPCRCVFLLSQLPVT